VHTTPRGLTNDAQPSHSEHTSTTKKRKLEDHGVVKHEDSKDLTAIERLKKDVSSAKSAYYKEKEERLIIQSKLNETEITAQKMKKKHVEAVMELRNDMNRMWDDAVKQEGVVVDLRSKLTQSKITINQFEIENHNLKEELKKHKSINRKLVENVSHPARRREPTFVPHPEPQVHSNVNYEHPQAPRENKVYKRFEETRKYAPGTGKVWPSKYGSSAHWDLGLCRVTFDTPQVCMDGGCEYRHHPLSVNERTYMMFLAPSGPQFLRHSDGCVRGKSPKPI
jgi:hypothetical protein